MSIVVNLQVKAKEDQFEALVAYFQEILPDTAKYKGAEVITCYTNPEDKSLTVHEIWDEKASQEAYLGWRAETGVVDKIVGMLREPPVFEERTHVPF